MNMIEEKKPTTLLFNPFVYIAGGQALLIGLAAILLAGLIGSLSNTHFDGVLDTHTGASAPLWVFLSEGFIDWLCLALVLLVVGRIVSKTPFRTIDLLGTQAMARWPTLLTSLICLPPAVRRFSNYMVEQITKPGGKIEFSGSDAVIFFAVVIAMIPLICWTIVLMYKSFSFCCNVKGAKAIWSFIGGLIVAEILSKIALHGIFKMGGVLK